MADVIHCPDCEHVLTDCGDVWHCPACEVHWTHGAIALAILDVAWELAELWS